VSIEKERIYVKIIHLDRFGNLFLLLLPWGRKRSKKARILGEVMSKILDVPDGIPKICQIKPNV